MPRMFRVAREGRSGDGSREPTRLPSAVRGFFFCARYRAASSGREASVAVKRVYARYQELQRYVGWTDEDARLVTALAPLVEPHLNALIDDFYDEIERHP